MSYRFFTFDEQTWVILAHAVIRWKVIILYLHVTLQNIVDFLIRGTVYIFAKSFDFAPNI